MKKFFSALFLSVLLVQAAQALTIGTFNVEYFHIAGTGGSTMSHPAYTREDVRDIARSILRSGADVLAMQEIQGEETMRYLVLNELHGCEVHMTHIVTPGDEAGLRRLGCRYTSDPYYASNALFTAGQ